MSENRKDQEIYTMDDLVKNIYKFFKMKNKPEKKDKNKVVSIIVGVVFLFVFFISIFQVGPDETSILLLFGKYRKTVGPGIHIFFPAPIGKKIIVKTTKIYRTEVGFRTISVGPPAKYENVPAESLMLTGDENILDLDFSVQYKIIDLKKYLFNIKNPSKAIKSSAEASMRQIVGSFNIDETLTKGKGNIQILALEKLQKILNKYDMGVKILNVQLQDVQPPKAVIKAFKDVASAREDRIRFINEANGYINDIIPKARGKAKKIQNEAIAYKEKRIKEANGNTARFLKLYKNYRLGKDVTKSRLYIEALEKNLQNTDKIIIDEDIKSGIMNILQGEVRSNEKNN